MFTYRIILKKKINDYLDGTISRIRHNGMYICVSKCLMIEYERLSWHVCFSLLYSIATNAILRQYCATYKSCAIYLRFDAL